MINTDTSIIDRLKKLKEKSGMTALQIAEKSGLPESTITRVLSGKTVNPTVTTVMAMTRAMGGTAADIFGDDVRVDVVSECAPTTQYSSELVQVYKDSIKSKDRYIKILAIAVAILVVFDLVVFLVDILNGGFGYIRYMQNHVLEFFSRLC